MSNARTNAKKQMELKVLTSSSLLPEAFGAGDPADYEDDQPKGGQRCGRPSRDLYGGTSGRGGLPRRHGIVADHRAMTYVMVTVAACDPETVVAEPVA